MFAEVFCIMEFYCVYIICTFVLCTYVTQKYLYILYLPFDGVYLRMELQNIAFFVYRIL